MLYLEALKADPDNKIVQRNYCIFLRDCPDFRGGIERHVSEDEVGQKFQRPPGAPDSGTASSAGIGNEHVVRQDIRSSLLSREAGSKRGESRETMQSRGSRRSSETGEGFADAEASGSETTTTGTGRPNTRESFANNNNQSRPSTVGSDTLSRPNASREGVRGRQRQLDSSVSGAMESTLVDSNGNFASPFFVSPPKGPRPGSRSRSPNRSRRPRSRDRGRSPGGRGRSPGGRPGSRGSSPGGRRRGSRGRPGSRGRSPGQGRRGSTP